MASHISCFLPGPISLCSSLFFNPFPRLASCMAGLAILASSLFDRQQRSKCAYFCLAVRVCTCTASIRVSPTAIATSSSRRLPSFPPPALDPRADKVDCKSVSSPLTEIGPSVGPSGTAIAARRSPDPRSAPAAAQTVGILNRCCWCS